MTTQLSFDSSDSSRCAVLSMDFHASIVSAYVKDEGLMARAASVLKQARNSDVRIIHVQVGFRPKFPEIGTRNALFNSLKNSVRHQQMFEGSARRDSCCCCSRGRRYCHHQASRGRFPGY
jgi:hypothetical protein